MALNVTPAQAERLNEIFLPHSVERTQKARNAKTRFVHYTTAENAMNIFRSKKMYMRNITCMNDYREFEHGLDLLVDFFHDPIERKNFFDAMNGVVPNLADEAIKRFDDWLPNNRFEIYVTCISEHRDDEDTFGRLSMWRAYNRPGAIGVALVINPEPLFEDSGALRTFLSPVAYLQKGEFKTQVNRVIANVKAAATFLQTLPREILVHSIASTLLFAAASLKHQGFREEWEWRVIHLPNLMPSSLLEKTREVIGGVPQTVYKIPLEKGGDLDASLARIVNRVIIGPSNFPYPMHVAFIEELRQLGVTHPEAMVVPSDIPLRT